MELSIQNATLQVHYIKTSKNSRHGTEWAGVAHTAPHWQLPVAIWANVATWALATATDA